MYQIHRVPFLTTQRHLATGILAMMLLSTPALAENPIDETAPSETEATENIPEDTQSEEPTEVAQPEEMIETPKPAPRPKYNNLRYEENWKPLKNTTGSDFWDFLKYIPLDTNGDIYLSLGGQWRLRGEGNSNFNFGKTTDTDSRDAVFGLSRMRFHGDLHLWDYFRLFVEGKSSLATTRNLPGGQRTLDVDTIDLQNLFIDLTLPLNANSYITLRPGRQELQYGKQRLISPLDWSNTRRSWDGVRGIAKWEGYRLDGFYTQFVNVDKFGFNAPFTSGLQNFGVYATGAIPATNLNADLYWLGWLKEKSTFGSVKDQTENRHTIGVRVNGSPLENLDFDVEGGYQLGTFATQNISAFFGAGEVGYKIPVFMAPRVYLGLDYASGDQDSNDGVLNTFNQYLPLGHAYHGFIDILSRQNLTDLSTGVALKPLDPLTLKLDGHAFWRSSTKDAVYNVGGGVLRAGDAGQSSFIGSELDFTASWKFDNHLTVVTGISYFLPGTFIQESGASNGATFGYLQGIYTF